MTFIYRDPVVLKTARDYARILRKRQQEDPRSKTFSPQEVVLEVIPRVLQGFWVLPRCSLLNMASKKLSQMSISVTKAVLDRVLSTLSNNAACQVDFSRIARDEIVQSILEEIRQTHPLDTLKKMLGNFEPALLTEIVSVAVKKICEVFQPQNAEELVPVEGPAMMPVQHHLNLVVTGEQPTTCSDVESPPSAPQRPLLNWLVLFRPGRKSPAQMSLPLSEGQWQAWMQPLQRPLLSNLWWLLSTLRRTCMRSPAWRLVQHVLMNSPLLWFLWPLWMNLWSFLQQTLMSRWPRGQERWASSVGSYSHFAFVLTVHRMFVWLFFYNALNKTNK